MHHSMQQRVDGLAALRARSLMATAEFYELIGRTAPAAKPLFQAVAKGKAWHIIELATGKTKRFSFSYRAAMHLIEMMEAGVTAECKNNLSTTLFRARTVGNEPVGLDERCLV